MRKKIPDFLKSVGSVFFSAGFKVYLVGGAVRNIVRGYAPVDYDLATDASPEEVMKLFRRVIPTGIKHGTVTVFYQGIPIEVTTFRIDGNYSNKRHPDSVSFTPSIEKDLERRDFTINSLALELNTGELLDPHGGRKDLKDGVIRAIGNPEERFSEDGLRLLRACRFASQLNFTVEPVTLKGMRACHRNLSHVSVERIRSEIEKMLSADKPSLSFLLMDQTGLMSMVFPEFDSVKNMGHKGPEGTDVFHHSLYACDGVPPSNLPVRLAALMHDLGKAVTAHTLPDGSEQFLNHENESSRLARGILTRLKFPKITEHRVCHLIAYHMFGYTSEWSDSAIRRFLARAGVEYIDDLILLRRADHYGTNGNGANHPYLDEFRKRIDRIVAAGDAITVRDLALNGRILHDEIGMPEGPMIGKILDLLLETVIDDPSQNDRETLLTIAGNIYHTSIRK